MRIMNGVSYKTREIVLSLSCDLPLYEVDIMRSHARVAPERRHKGEEREEGLHASRLRVRTEIASLAT